MDHKSTITEEPAPAGPWSDLKLNLPPKEPLSRAPWPPLLIAALLIGLYAWQVYSGDAAACTAGDPAAACVRYAFSPDQLDAGRWQGLFTALFMHGSWGHVLFNSIFAVAFGSAVSQLFGGTFRGVVAFFVFFLICGLVGNLGYALVHPHGTVPVIGASGGIAGFMGAASRLLDRRRAGGGFAGLAPFTSRTVVAMAAAWVVLNLVVGVFGINIGFGAAGQPIAWEAHVFGYAAGLFLIGPFARLLATRRRHAPGDDAADA